MNGMDTFRTQAANGDESMSPCGNAAAVDISQHHQPGALRKVGAFLWHLLQIVIAMEVGMFVYHLLASTLLAGTGYAALTNEYPLFGYWMMVVGMVVGMVVFMRWQRSNWGHCLEMTLAMVAPVAALTALVGSDVVSARILYALGDPLMILAMAVYMLFRPHAHADGVHGSHGSHEARQLEMTEHAALAQQATTIGK